MSPSKLIGKNFFNSSLVVDTSGQMGLCFDSKVTKFFFRLYVRSLFFEKTNWKSFHLERLMNIDRRREKGEGVVKPISSNWTWRVPQLLFSELEWSTCKPKSLSFCECTTIQKICVVRFDRRKHSKRFDSQILIFWNGSRPRVSPTLPLRVHDDSLERSGNRGRRVTLRFIHSNLRTFPDQTEGVSVFFPN